MRFPKVIELKAGLQTRHFRGSVFCRSEKHLLFFTFLTFKNLYNTLKERKNQKKHNRSIYIIAQSQTVRKMNTFVQYVLSGLIKT